VSFDNRVVAPSTNRLTTEERKQVHLLTVTTDPEIDAPKVLSAYGKRYGADFDNWSFLTGEVSALEKFGETSASA
jgi:Uncharacterized protein SCO1/SenC/PrrC, involved in biogenesis of respiratory and photosynthetic systems